jgi:hypothetical protein
LGGGRDYAWRHKKDPARPSAREKEAVLRNQARTVAVAALALGALAAPATAQIIATSIPKSIAGGGEGRWAFHLMYSPFAKWKINTFEEDPAASNFLATSGNPKASFLGAAEVAFKAGDAVTLGVGGWYNKIGNKTSDYLFLGVNNQGDSVLFAGPMNLDVSYTEGHANLFYKDLGVQFGLVHNSRTVNAISADIAQVGGLPGDLDQANALLNANVVGAKDTANDTDGYLIYKAGGNSGNDTNWSFSLGGGFYRYDIVKKTVPSAFATATVGLYRGLGVDASYWYVGKTKRSELQRLLAAGGADLDQNLSRWMVGVSYTFSSR